MALIIDNDMFPKITHYCWFGRGEKPSLARKCIASWERFFPDYEIKEWNEDSFDVNIIPYTAEAYKEGKYAFVSDYTRFWVLYHYGGVYFDTDVEVIRPLSDIIEKGPFMGFESVRPGSKLAVAPGLGLAAEPGMELYGEILDRYESLRFRLEDGALNPCSMIPMVTELLKDNGLKGDGTIEHIAGVDVYPPDWFNPFDDATGRLRKKACWVHTDYSTIDVDTDLELPVWDGYDKIVAVSDAASDAFVARFPSLKEKMVTIGNIVSPEYVGSRAEAFDAELEMPKEEGVTRLLSVGRFTEAKNYDNVPDICRRIIEAGVPVKWYIIGYGGDEPLIRRKITEAGMEDNVILLGKRANPYPYFKACDIYVQPSRFEGNAVTVREAQILCKPVVVTAYPTAISQVQNGIDGMIVPLDNESCATALSEVIVDAAKLKRYESNLRARDYDNKVEVEQFIALI